MRSEIKFKNTKHSSIGFLVLLLVLQLLLLSMAVWFHRVTPRRPLLVASSVVPSPQLSFWFINIIIIVIVIIITNIIIISIITNFIIFIVVVIISFRF